MTIEIWSIALMSLMLLALTMAQGGSVARVQGFAWGLGSRDESREYTALQGRYARTIQNQFESMLAFVPLMALAIAFDKTGTLTTIAAWCLIIGRASFIVFYLSGTFALRSVGYLVGLVGIFLTVWALLG